MNLAQTNYWLSQMMPGQNLEISTSLGPFLFWTWPVCSGEQEDLTVGQKLLYSSWQKKYYSSCLLLFTSLATVKPSTTAVYFTFIMNLTPSMIWTWLGISGSMERKGLTLTQNVQKVMESIYFASTTMVINNYLNAIFLCKGKLLPRQIYKISFIPFTKGIMEKSNF